MLMNVSEHSCSREVFGWLEALLSHGQGSPLPDGRVRSIPVRGCARDIRMVTYGCLGVVYSWIYEEGQGF